MMANDWQRLHIWLTLENRFDHQAFTAACLQAGCETLPPHTFAQKAGMVSCAMAAHPQMPPADAYLKFIEDHQPVIAAPVPVPSVETQSDTVVMKECGACSESKGLGDTIAKITHATGLDKLAELYTHVTGKPCGCTKRQEVLNKLIPYGVKEEV